MTYRKLLSPLAIFLISLSAIAPVKAQVEQIYQVSSVRQINVTLKTQNNQTFNQLIQQAEIQATSLIEQEFATNTSITEVAVNVLGDRQGEQVPLLFSRVSRIDWQQQPTIRQWTKYFPTSAVLLGFNQPQKTPPPPTQSTPSTPKVQSVTPTSNPSNSLPPTSASQKNATPAPSGASLEEADPGYR